AFNSPSYDPCNKYTSLDQPWRANNKTGLNVCDSYLSWNGWYRFFYYGMNIRMAESCVPTSRCGTYYSLWLNGPHPEVEDGVVTRQVCGNAGSDCCYFGSTSVRVKACPGNYYVYELVRPVQFYYYSYYYNNYYYNYYYYYNYCDAAYCTDVNSINMTSATPTTGAALNTTMTNASFDPCDNYTVLDDYWRSTSSYSRDRDDTVVEWTGWYRLYLQGESAQLPDWCVNYMLCGGYTPLWLAGPHPKPNDGIVTREIYGAYGRQCRYYKSNPVQVKACSGQYYVYRLSKPDVSLAMPTYCAAVISSPSYDPCSNYTSLDQPWRGSNGTGLDICDSDFSWSGWYRFFYYGMDIRMAESCVPTSRCGTYYTLWLNGPHPEVEDGVVTRQVCGNAGSDCCYFGSTSVRVKACPGNYYVYELVAPVHYYYYYYSYSLCNAAYCTGNTAFDGFEFFRASVNLATRKLTTQSNSSFDACDNYTVLDNYWRTTKSYYRGHDDTVGEWTGWYRLYLQGESAQLPEWCVNSYMSCGGYTPLWLAGPHPRLKDGIVTREVYGAYGSQCRYYKSNPVQVKACSGQYYVYKLVKPALSIPMPSYCTAVISIPSYDPCNNYISLDQPWRANNETGLNICDSDFSWNGWYRFFYYGMNIRMAESCIPTYRCGTYYSLWLSGPHPEVEDGVVTRQVCGNAGSDCCYFGSTSVRVKACPGNYYVYELVRPVQSYYYYYSYSLCNAAYCTDVSTITPTPAPATAATGGEFNSTMLTTQSNSSFDPCDNYTVLDNYWRTTKSYYRGHDDTVGEWTGWYRLYLQGESAQLPEWCVNSYMSCGGYTPLWLAGLHPRPKDGIVNREIYGAYGSQCRYYKSNPVQVKACSGQYYVYKLVKPALSIPMPSYCTAVISIPSYDPCNNYISLDQPWRANNETGLNICDGDFSWSGWYRLFYYGMNIRMAESCVPTYRCGTYYSLWLNGPHPEIEDGVVTRQVCGNAGSDCCYFGSTSVRVKACPGNYYVYELVHPVHYYYYYYYNYYSYYYYYYYSYSICNAAYCTVTTQSNSSFDPCDSYTVLDNYWRTTKSYYRGHDDTVGEWTGWYRLYLQGESAQLPEGCVNSYVSCGGYTPLWLAGSHPRPKDGIVTREIYGAYGSQCRYYKSNPVQVKACSGQYYVYKLVKPALSIPMPSYCTAVINIPGYDPCDNYTSLDQPWRANNETGLNICDGDFSWNGWYRFFYYGMNIRMAESCVPTYRCGTYYSLWLNGPHPEIEDGVVTRQVCGNAGSDCCYFGSTSVRVKACPGNYYVYELVRPVQSYYYYSYSFCNAAYCTVTTQSNSSFDPCDSYTVLDNYWRTTKSYYRGHDDTVGEWTGWYRLYLQGESAQLPEWCVDYVSCGGYTPLWLAGSHPRLKDGIVTREIYGAYGSQCRYYKSNPVQVKACSGQYYVYKLVKPALSIPVPSYCTAVISSPSYDPCDNYISLDQPWRANNETGLNICDSDFSWNGWYRFFYYGINIRMAESCVPTSRCGTYYTLWLNGPHPEVEDGVVTRQVCGNAGSDCCYFGSTSVRVKACPGNYYVYELVHPVQSYYYYYYFGYSFCNAAYCTVTTQSNSSFDPCDSYTVLDNYWRTTKSYYRGHDDTVGEWTGWYRLYLQGESAQLPEWCVDYVSCGGYTPLWLAGSHPRLKDGIVTREIYGAYGSQCRYYKSNPVQVKACSGQYYVYKLVKPALSIPMPSYCTAVISSPSYDPCDNYISLDQPWRANNETGLNICDGDFSWNGWYRLFYYGMNIRMAESCVPTYRCGTYYSLWLNGPHPEIEDGVVTRQVCGNAGSDCCYFGSTSVRVKACPGNYYVYELVRPVHYYYYYYYYNYYNYFYYYSYSVCNAAYCTVTTQSNSSFDPCDSYTVLDNYWRTTKSYYRGHDDTVGEWTGWYRLYLQGESARLPEWCVNYMSCGGYTPLWLAGLHPRLKDGIVTREVYGAYGNQCRYYKSNPVQVKACSGQYYVYKLVKPAVSIPMPSYCTAVISIPTYDPCDNYISLDQPWRANNETGLNICDGDFSWSGWYRFFYYGMNIRMAESCVPTSRCGTYYSLWLNGPHPELEDGVVTRQVCGNAGSDCCYFGSTSVRVKACPGNYYVYELVRPVHYYYYYYSYSLCNAAYCTDVSTVNPTPAPTTAATGGEFNSTMLTTQSDSSFDPCDSYTVLDNYWRTTKSYYRGHDDTVGEWTGWYRLYLQGESAQLPEWCVNYMSCGGYTPLWLAGLHPRPKDGIVTREVYGAYGSQCRYYKSNPVQVKACSGQYYVYKLVKPAVSIPMPSYCTAVMSIPSYDPCTSYTSLDQPWRANNETGLWISDSDFSWSGWYRLFYYGMNIRMSESCVPIYRCGSYYSLWLNGPHPEIEDGVVTRQVCGNAGSGMQDCCYFGSTSVRVKACPGNYYVYELVRPVHYYYYYYSYSLSNAAYCTDVSSITPTPVPTLAAADGEFNSTMLTTQSNSSFDPCDSYTVLDNYWRTTKSYYRGHDDTVGEWSGWYRLYLQGESAQLPEWCVNSYVSCGGYTPLWLAGPHPRLKDGIVTREIYGAYENQCRYYKSNPVQVKACSGQYYVYKLVKPALSIPMPSYCTVAFTIPSVDPCFNYNVLNDTWRSTSYTYNTYACDVHTNWNGWYRLFYEEKSVQMPNSCVSEHSCGTDAPLWLNGPHPELEDGVVGRQVCGSWNNDCCYFKSYPIQVKACPGNYYVYEFISPSFCSSAYCADTTTKTLGKITLYQYMLFNDRE
ncbi:hypothetical protein NFI96_024892, partial [Prochilodus magdalenae]